MRAESSTERLGIVGAVAIVSATRFPGGGWCRCCAGASDDRAAVAQNASSAFRPTYDRVILMNQYCRARRAIQLPA